MSKGITVTGGAGYRCPKHGPTEPVLYKRANGYLHRRCRICRDEMMRKHRKRYNADFRHNEKFRAARRQERKGMRLRVLAKYGNRCACCLLTGHHFLTFDHVKNDGVAHRKTFPYSGTRILELLDSLPYDPDRFQVLCWNCNHAKAQNGGICPHESLRSFVGEAGA